MACEELGSRLIVVDTSAAIAIADPRDQHHLRTVTAFARVRGPFVVPAGVMAEIAYFFERRFGIVVIDAFLRQIEDGHYVLDCGEGDIGRVRALVNRYADLPLGYADASVIACAERLGAPVITADHHFQVVASEGTFTVVP